MKLDNLIYISGAGRSGSTLLERVLHSADGVIALGELHCLWRLPRTSLICSCGTPFRKDEFWREVLTLSNFDDPTFAELRRLEACVSRSRYIGTNRFSIERLSRQPEVVQFLELQTRLLDSVAQVSGASTVVDSSKVGPRAWLLSCSDKTKVVHLQRDPSDVLTSWRSHKFDPGLGENMARLPVSVAALNYWKIEQLSRLLERHRPVVKLDYRDFCTAPKQQLSRVLEQCNLAGEIAPNWSSDTAVTPKANYHSLNGNPDRFETGTIEISVRRPSRNQLSPREQLSVSLLATGLRGVSRARASRPTRHGN